MQDLYFSTDTGADESLDAAAAAALAESGEARYLLVRRGRVLGHGGGGLAWTTRAELQAQGVDLTDAAFLGCVAGRAHFAVVAHEPPLSANDRFTLTRGPDADGYIGLYEAAVSLEPAEALLAARAVHFANWINRSRHCGVCGAPTRAADAGHKRVCTNAACGREEFPRTDPVVIVLVTHGDRCLLGRQPRFPPRRYSAVAGFVQPGETLEAAVRREVYEEVGLRLRSIAYRGSQPWPFPTSLMLGFHAEAVDEHVSLNDGELEEARWCERADVAAWAAAPPETQTPVTLPPRGVMARRLIEDWLNGA